MTPRIVLAAAVLAAFTCSAYAQNLKPGLWEINNKMSTSSGELEQAMAEMKKEMANMSPEDRKMMQDMMAKQGIGMGSGTTSAIKMCLTKEMIDRNEMASQKGDCKYTNSPRSGNTMKMSFVCNNPRTTGEGQVTFNSPESYVSKMTVNSTDSSGKPEKMNMDATGKWLSADCGNIKPINVPKK